MARSLRIVGPGRAGTSLARALERAGWRVHGLLARDDDLRQAAGGVDLLVIATPDSAVADVAATVEPDPATVVAHMAGSLGLDVLVPHERRAVLHPLVALPNADIGAERFASGAWFGLADGGDPLADEVVTALRGHALHIRDADRPRYHAAAVIASNHLVGLLGQADRVAASVGVPLAAYLDLVRDTVDNVGTLGPAAALTGPVKRGDTATVERHLAALPDDERAAYEAGVELCRRLRGERDDRLRGERDERLL
ncbi:MAG: Rossmann-like and DUF2520 domain-containing protein [Acidimicrobiales bacterium]